MHKQDKPLPEVEVSDRHWKVRSALSFAVLIALLAGAWLAYRAVAQSRQEAGTPVALRKTLEFNERLFATGFDTGRLATSYPASAAAARVRVNGRLGIRNDADTANWKLHVLRPGTTDTLLITIDEIKALPRKEIVFDFKCIEGWSQVTRWAGVPLKTFLEHYGLQNAAKMNYVGLATPDGGYYVGIDMASALHAQTLLCYEMNGKPLPMNQGYPLRLIIPVKYGVKHLKRIGTMSFSNSRPPDYWAEQGYDYYTGH